MYKILRIIFCVLAVAAAAAAVFVFVYGDMIWGIATIAFCAFSALLMVVFKNLQIKEEMTKNPPPAAGDFITGKEKKDEDEK